MFITRCMVQVRTYVEFDIGGVHASNARLWACVARVSALCFVVWSLRAILQAAIFGLGVLGSSFHALGSDSPCLRRPCESPESFQSRHGSTSKTELN